MHTKLLTGVALATLMLPAAAFAQSTGSSEIEDIVVTGSKGPGDVGGIQTPDAPKARAVLTQELIERRPPGQAIFDTINLVPGVNFTNSDPYGSSGGNLRIRGFDGNRVSATFDGIPTNDSGNYALYTNQQLDPELIEQVNVNFGATDVDSPTASASGGTVNYRSITPKDELSAALIYSRGTFDMNRVMGILHTGVLTSFGTKAWVAASTQRYNQFRGPGELYKQQYNGKVYQPIGGNGDFISVAGHYNQNRPNFYNNPALTNFRTLLGTSVIPTTATAANPFKVDLTREQYDRAFNDPATQYDAFCSLPTPGAGVQDARNSCSNYYGLNYNPSNTGNIRVNSRFTLTDKLTLTFDGGYAYSRANGGGSNVFAEADANSSQTGVYTNQFQRVGAGIAAGADLNGDRDTLDYVRVYFPSNTRTHRLTGIANLRYNIDDDNLVRIAYAYDRARHRQTGETGQLASFGDPLKPFSALDGDNPVADAAGNVMQKRNRLSYAILHQVSGEYRGSLFEDRLKLQLGVRAPFFRRNLNNYCFTISGSGTDAYCTSQSVAQVEAATSPVRGRFGAPYVKRIKTYKAVLPNVGFTFNILPAASVFGSYAKGMSVPRTDNLYAFDDVKFRPTNELEAEKTDSFDLGLRYTTSMIQAQVAAWYIHYNNRIITSTETLEGGGTINVDRNIGATRTKGVDASLGIQPIRNISLYGFVSYIDSELLNDAINPVNGAVLAATKGKFVVETPKWQYGGRIQANFDPVSVGLQAKHVGDRFVTDNNDLISPGYTVVDLDARVALGFAGLDRTFFQLNVTNLLKERYFGNLSTATSGTGTTRYTFGSPRTVIGSVHFEF